MQTVKTEIHYRQQDYNNAYQLISTSQFPFRSRLALILGLAFTLVALIWGYFDFVVSGYNLGSYKNWLPHAFLLFSGLAGIFMHFFLLKKSYDGKDTKGKRNYTFTATPDGFELEGKQGYAHFEWQEMERVVAGRQVMLFVIEGNKFYIIPRHSFDNTQWKQLREWVRDLV